MKSYYLFNGHGDVVQLTDASGTVTKNYDYDAFGNEKNADENDTNVFRYSGEYYDKETGTIYLRARYYDPNIGRFISEDSVRGEDKDPLSLNLYTYGNNNPVMYGDPSGHWVVDALFLAFDLYQLSQNWTPGNVTWVLFDVLTFGDPTGFLTITLHGAETLKAAKALEATGVLKPTMDAIEKGGVKFLDTVATMVNSGNKGAGNAAANLGKSYGKFGTVVKNPGVKITGFSGHAVNQAITRGVKTEVIQNTVKNPIAVLSQRGGNSFAYVSNEAVVVIKNTGEIITIYGKNNFDAIVQQVLKEAIK